MSTFIELVQTAHRESGASGTAPAGVAGQVGEANRFVNWVKLEWTKIQNRHPNWKWMRREFTVNTVALDDTYAYSDCTDVLTSVAISRFARWYPDEFKCYLASAGVGSEMWLSYAAWNNFKRVYRIGSQTAGAPAIVTVDPSNNIVLGPKPSGIYTVGGDYHASPQILTADADTPEMPTRFHDLIWMGALRRYAAYESAPEVWSEMKSQQSELMRSLEQDQLPEPNFAEPLA